MTSDHRSGRSLSARRRSVVLLLLMLGAPMLRGDVEAQGVRGWVGSTVQMVELRPIGLDTVPIAEVLFTEGGQSLFEGRPAVCITGDVCTVYRTLPKVWAVAATQDLSLTAWGLGLQGLSFSTLMRGRAGLGSDFPWPRADDEFDLMLGYAQLHRGSLRLRLGRQEVRSGLGFPAFDGAWARFSIGPTGEGAWLGVFGSLPTRRSGASRRFCPMRALT